MFFGVPQSQYAALAILIAIVIVSLTILFSDSPVPVSQKFGFVLMVFLVSLPGLALSLFQLTCIVTGAGATNKRWWCSLYAWVLSAIMIFYSILLVIAAIMSLTSKKKESFGIESFYAPGRAPSTASGPHQVHAPRPVNSTGHAPRSVNSSGNASIPVNAIANTHANASLRASP